MSNKMFIPLLLSLLFLHTTVGDAQLLPGFYSTTCSEAESTVRKVMKKAMIRETRNVASIMRLQFHDCFVNGCDGSLLLDDTPTMIGEKLALSNINSLIPESFEIIDEIKVALENICPRVVSCADIVIIASRDAVALSGGPDWEVKLGRKDSLYASQEDSDNILPSPRANAMSLIELFAKFNLSTEDLVALSGSHSIGKARCFSVLFRLQSGMGNSDPTIDPHYMKELHRLCPLGGDEDVTGNMDGTPTVFDNQYFKDLVAGRGFLISDQTLYTFEETRKWVVKFSEDQGAFFDAFVKGMVKMGDLQSGQPGEVRQTCRVVNRQPVDQCSVAGNFNIWNCMTNDNIYTE